MPPDGWLAGLTLREGPDEDVRRRLESSTPWRLTDKGMLPIEVDDYLSLLDWTGRRRVSGKSGSIPEHLAPILERLSIRPQRWVESVSNFEKWFGRVVGRAENLARHVAQSGRRWIRGANRCAVWDRLSSEHRDYNHGHGQHLRKIRPCPTLRGFFPGLSRVIPAQPSSCCRSCMAS